MYNKMTVDQAVNLLFRTEAQFEATNHEEEWKAYIEGITDVLYALDFDYKNFEEQMLQKWEEEK